MDLHHDHKEERMCLSIITDPGNLRCTYLFYARLEYPYSALSQGTLLSPTEIVFQGKGICVGRSGFLHFVLLHLLLLNDTRRSLYKC